MKPSLKKPIFVVGLPRTGSKLLMNVINNNEQANYCIANEVQFFGHSFFGRLLQGRRGIMPLIEEARDRSSKICWERAVDNLYSGRAKGVHWNGLSAGWLKIPKSALLRNLEATDGSPKAIYEAILSTQEQEHDGYGDKSGPNLYFVDKLIQWFPDGKVLHIIRDPRAILSSQHKRLLTILDAKDRSPAWLKGIKRMCYSPVIVLYILSYWGYAMRVDRKFSRSHPQNYMLVQYEELVLKPEETTRKICDFLGMPWDPGMTAPRKYDSSYIDPRENAVKKVVDRGTGMDQEALDRWRKHIRPWMKTAVAIYGALFYRGDLKRFGYTNGNHRTLGETTPTALASGVKH